MALVYTKFKVFAETNIDELTVSDMRWLPLYKDNDIRDNDMLGYYCIIAVQNEENEVTAYKYTALFQHREHELGSGIIDKEEIEQYILFEKKYEDVIGSLEYPHPDDERKWTTFTVEDINDYGQFVHAYASYKTTRIRALNQFKTANQ